MTTTAEKRDYLQQADAWERAASRLLSARNIRLYPRDEDTQDALDAYLADIQRIVADDTTADIDTDSSKSDRVVALRYDMVAVRITDMADRMRQRARDLYIGDAEAIDSWLFAHPLPHYQYL